MMARRLTMSITVAGLLTLAGCTPAGTPVSAQQIARRATAVLAVLSPIVDELPSMGMSTAQVNRVIVDFNTARSAALLLSQNTVLLPTTLDQFVQAAQSAIAASTPVAVRSGRFSELQMRELSVAVSLIPSLVQAVSSSETSVSVTVPEKKTYPQ